MLSIRPSPIVISVRRIHHSGYLGRKNELDRAKEHFKKLQDQKWRKRINANPFERNVGASGVFKEMGLRPDNPYVAKYPIKSALASANPEYTALDMWDKSGQFEATLKKPTDHVSHRVLKRILDKKNFFPDPKEPELLTWSERQTIRYLHAKDPVQWDTQTLAEAFPVTENIIKKIVNGKSYTKPEGIKKLNEAVRNNWRKLAHGDLKMSDGLRKHILSQKGKGRKELLSREEREKMEDELVKRLIKDREIKTYLPQGGKFASIICDYKAKVSNQSKGVGTEAESSEKEKELVEFKSLKQSLFSDHSEFDPAINVPSVYRDTALLSHKLGTHKNDKKLMRLDDFRHEYLYQPHALDKLPDSELRQKSPNRFLMKKWLQNEISKQRREAKVEKVDVDSILRDIREERKKKLISGISKYKTGDEDKATFL